MHDSIETPFGIAGLRLEHEEQLELAAQCGVGCVQVICDFPEEAADWNEAFGHRWLSQIAKFAEKARQCGIQVFLQIPVPDPQRMEQLHVLAAQADGLVKQPVAGVVLDFGAIEDEEAPDAMLRQAYEVGAMIQAANPQIQFAVFVGGASSCLMETMSAIQPAANRPTVVASLAGSWQSIPAQVRSITANPNVSLLYATASGPDTAAGEQGTDGENMRQVIYRSVIALAAGAPRILWADLLDSAENEADRRGLFSADGLRMKPSYAAYRNAVYRLWPFERIVALEEGPAMWAYRFEQPGGQTTTVVWSTDTYGLHEWKIEGAPTSFRIVDVGGSLAHNTNSVPLSADPVFIIEHLNGEARKFPAHGNMLTPSRQPFTPRAFCFPTADEIMIQDGWDWSLPEEVKPEIYSGFFNFAERPSQDIRIIGWHPKWGDWHISPGRYDFSSLERKLDEAHAGNFRIGIRLQSVVKPNVPEWVISRYQPPETKLGGRFAPTIVAPWHSDVRKQFEELVAELGSRGFHRDPALVFASIHGISQSVGEEFSLPPNDIRHLEQTTGLTPLSMREWILGRISAWGVAFGDQSYKLAWVGNSGAFAAQEYRKIAAEAVELALSLGMGTRGGFIEMYNYMWNERAVGQYRSPDGYLMTDEEFPAIVNGSYFADENEEYITVKRWRFGLLEEDDHRWRVSTLRALQMRRNFLATYPMAMDIDRHLTEYTRLSMGKTIDNTPDAWSYLREAYVGGNQGKPLPLKNMERWLFQRDIPGGMTQPAMRVERSYAMTTDPDGIRHEYAARRTDRVSGNDYMYFRLHDSFAGQAAQAPIVLKITYLDQSDADWMVEYTHRTLHALHRTTAVHSSNDGRIKTATFCIQDAVFSNSLLPDGQHFRIYNGGQADVTVLFVRVIRL